MFAFLFEVAPLDFRFSDYIQLVSRKTDPKSTSGLSSSET